MIGSFDDRRRVVPGNIHTSSMEGHWKFQSQTSLGKYTYDTKLEFPEDRMCWWIASVVGVSTDYAGD